MIIDIKRECLEAVIAAVPEMISHRRFLQIAHKA